ncbi:hypothetical protein RRG08_030411 [Elysia crispata]|uniref:Uncharacterized protein n=1 Tax=Elysia crispata TaxID=231223 RepID=A0AAE0YFT0_9GAST|nr:hypothetical protein RRG08_030411 [Elysia crispata]
MVVGVSPSITENLRTTIAKRASLPEPGGEGAKLVGNGTILRHVPKASSIAARRVIVLGPLECEDGKRTSGNLDTWSLEAARLVQFA